MITLKRINGKHLVTVDGKQFVFDTMLKAIEYISDMKEVNSNE